MKCKIEGCGRELTANRKASQVCQKHYFRFWRYGTYDLVRPRGAGGISADNDGANLRPVCSGCNTSRTKRGKTKIFSHEGMEMTVTQLARLPGVTVSRAWLVQRLASGMSVAEALFSTNKTYPKRQGAL